ncbi:MAG TPA: hypothetical protein C5S51_01505 [Methanosarcinaceae archaeon]|nr:hypothetical protein [Methanosarcinaceae archaeon]
MDDEIPDGYKMTELGALPEGWEVKKIDAFLDKIIDYRGETPHKTEWGIPLLTAKNVRRFFAAPSPPPVQRSLDHRRACSKPDK